MLPANAGGLGCAMRKPSIISGLELSSKRMRPLTGTDLRLLCSQVCAASLTKRLRSALGIVVPIMLKRLFAADMNADRHTIANYWIRIKPGWQPKLVLSRAGH